MDPAPILFAVTSLARSVSLLLGHPKLRHEWVHRAPHVAGR